MEFKEKINKKNIRAGLTIPDKSKGPRCLFCNEGRKCGQNQDTEFVCGDCSIILSNASPENLERGFRKAISFGKPLSDNQAKAIEMFMNRKLTRKIRSEHMKQQKIEKKRGRKITKSNPTTTTQEEDIYEQIYEKELYGCD